MLQLLIRDITVRKPEPHVALVQALAGGVCEELRVELPRPTADRWRHDAALIERVRELVSTCATPRSQRV
ncbi:MAG: hypothetical protein R3C59_06835 [Planctomycetaceae bacterium]